MTDISQYSDSCDPFAPHPNDVQDAMEWLGHPRMDVGCGPNPLPNSDRLLDMCSWNNPNIEQINFYKQSLPKGYNVYCRHVIEDLRYPEILLEQFKNCDRGWIETPHPFVEFTRGVDHGLPFRGFSHHYWFCWVENDTLILCPKYSVVEHFIDIGTLKYVNTYYKWKDYQFKYRILENGLDFSITDKSYFDRLTKGITGDVNA